MHQKIKTRKPTQTFGYVNLAKTLTEVMEFKSWALSLKFDHYWVQNVETVEPLSFKNTCKIHFYTISENLISDVISW